MYRGRRIALSLLCERRTIKENKDIVNRERAEAKSGFPGMPWKRDGQPEKVGFAAATLQGPGTACATSGASTNTSGTIGTKLVLLALAR